MNEVIYLCDRKACLVCNGDICSHTTDIKHAVNFEKIANDKYSEKKRLDHNAK